jgi:hypothetical protein
LSGLTPINDGNTRKNIFRQQILLPIVIGR